ncbi:MAG: NAD(P)-binding protein [Campylobacter sp.]|nr:NAD(P)-binding protein [Campylobacter sp.]
MQEKFYETVIVGGGLAGIFCARKLKEAGREFMLISDNIGGRVKYVESVEMNFGGVFYFENYHHVRQLLIPGPKLIQSPKQIMLHTSKDEYFPLVSFRMLKNVCQLYKFKKFMKKFINHYEIYKKNCETMQVKDALKTDPFMNDLFYKSAPEIINELGINDVCKDLVSKFAFGCTGSKVNLLTALDYLNCVQGLVMPIYQFKFDANAVQKDIGNVTISSVISVEKQSANDYVIKTDKDEIFRAKNVVMATPAGVTKKLLNLPKIRSASVLYAYLVKGEIKEKYSHNDLHIFSDDIPIIFISRRLNKAGEYEVFSNEELNFSEYFDKYEIMHQEYWGEALYTYPAIVLDQDMGDGLYMAGDHNGLGMEPAAISGIWAANEIIKR